MNKKCEEVLEKSLVMMPESDKIKLKLENIKEEMKK